MIALGVWQLARRSEKLVALERYAANFEKPEMAFPRLPVGDENSFRRASAFCLEVTGWQSQGGRAASGANGWRHIARCRTGAEGPALLIDMGVSSDPKFAPIWKGGQVKGTITHAPDHRPLLAGLFDSEPKHLMLISEAAAPAGAHGQAGPFERAEQPPLLCGAVVPVRAGGVGDLCAGAQMAAEAEGALKLGFVACGIAPR